MLKFIWLSEIFNVWNTFYSGKQYVYKYKFFDIKYLNKVCVCVYKFNIKKVEMNEKQGERHDN